MMETACWSVTIVNLRPTKKFLHWINCYDRKNIKEPKVGFIQLEKPHQKNDHTEESEEQLWTKSWHERQAQTGSDDSCELQHAAGIQGTWHGAWKLTDHTYLENNWLEDRSIDLPCEQRTQMTGKRSGFEELGHRKSAEN